MKGIQSVLFGLRWCHSPCSCPAAREHLGHIWRWSIQASSLWMLRQEELVGRSCVKRRSHLLFRTFVRARGSLGSLSVSVGVVSSLCGLHIFSLQTSFQISSAEPQSDSFNWLSHKRLIYHLLHHPKVIFMGVHRGLPPKHPELSNHHIFLDVTPHFSGAASR